VETKFSKCVKKGLKADIQNLNIISQNEFRDALFPWFERSTAPKNVEELSILLSKSAIRERINKLGVDAVINVSGKTIQEKWQGQGGGGYGAVVGYGHSDETTYMTATVWNLKDKTIFATNKNVIGTNYLIVIGLPIYIPASTESSACNETVNRISDYLQNKDSPKRKRNINIIHHPDHR
jgi:hypothetical protein